MNELYNLNSWGERLNYFIEKTPDDVGYSKTYRTHLLNSVYLKIKAILKYEEKPNGSLITPTMLIRPTEHVLPITEDYNLSKVI